jgi:hypothetical protein
MRKDGVQPHHAVVGVTGEPEDMVMVQPELADDDEADEPTQKFGQQFKQMMGQFAHARMVLERRDFEFENQQCDDDGENAVAERLDSAEPQLPLPETIQEAHDLRPPALRSETCATNTMQSQRASQKRLCARQARLRRDN